MANCSSHFFIDRKYTTFNDWRFVHRARLGLITNSMDVTLVKTRIRDAGSAVLKKSCLMCSVTVWYIVYFTRDVIMQWLSAFKKPQVVGGQLKAKIVLWEVPGTGLTWSWKKKRTVLLLLMLPFRLKMVLTRSRWLGKEKEDKYDVLAKDFISCGFKARVEAFIVGTLRSCHPENDRVDKRLCSNKFLKVIRKIIVSETISYSQDVYQEHLRRTPQDSFVRKI